jgi:uncharacterized repeat protein (TIGR01451 family)
LDYSDGNAAAPAYVPDPMPHLGVSVTTEPAAPYKRGDVIRFLIVVNNNGEAPIPFARVSAQFTNLTIVNVNPSFPDACHQLPCDLRDIPPNANVSVFVRARIGDGTSFRGVIAAMSRPPDTDTGDNRVIVEGEVESPVITDNDSGKGDTKPTTNSVPASADISVAISSIPDALRRPGEPVMFLITIHNAGPQAATNVNIDLTAENMRLDEVSKACSKVPCTVPQIAPNSDATLLVHATVRDSGLFRSLVRASSGNDDDPNMDNNSASYDGVIVSPPPPNKNAALAGNDVPRRKEVPWIWICVAVLGLIGAGGVATHAIRKARWSRKIEVRPRIDPRGEITVGPIKPVISIEMRMRIEPGETESSPIPIRDT